MEEISIPSREDNLEAFRQFQALNGGPAYLRRAHTVEAALEHLLSQCRTQRDEWLSMVRLRLGTLREQAGSWDALRAFVSTNEELHDLQRLHDDLAPQLRLPVETTTAPKVLRQALQDLRESIELFNHRWERYLSSLDLSKLNELREGYNRYYLLEKECALRSPRLARMGYAPLKQLQAEDLLAILPPLRLPS